MYLKYFGFTIEPFSIAPNPSNLYMSPFHQEALAHLLYGTESGGFVLLSGEVGTGKTTLCRHLLAHLPKNTNIALIFNPMLNAHDLLATICDELKIKHRSKQTDKGLIDSINKYLLKAYADGHNTLLIIDEAQNLSSEVLEQLRLLTNLETNDKKLLKIILAGQPELLDNLAKKNLRQLAQRITARYHLRALSYGQFNSYIQHRLDIAGVRTPLFSVFACYLLYYHTKGIPRLINTISDRALLGAYASNERLVTARHVRIAAHEIKGHVKRWRLGKYKPIILRLATIITICAVIAVIIFKSPQIPFQFQLTLGAKDSDISTTVTANDKAPTLGASAEGLSNPEDIVAPIVIEKELPLKIPDNATAETSKENALVILFNRWGLNYNARNHGDACFYALRHRLRCLKVQGNIKQLLNYNRPAMLHQVVGNDDRYHDVVLIAKEDGKLLLTIGSNVARVNEEDLGDHWNGGYTLLWRPPEAYSLPLRQGDSGPLVTWLANRRAQMEGGAIIASWTLDGDLLTWLEEFQNKSQIKDNGVINPETVIMISNAINSDAPRITQN